MPSRFDPQSTPSDRQPEKTGVGKIDTSKRYDVYCLENGVRTVVHRNVLFRGRRALFDGEKDRGSRFEQYIELELPSGDAVFLTRTWIIRFCEHGVEVPTEVVSAKEQNVR